MKIEKIKFKNIHSLKGEHSIDFNEKPLKDAGLFAITGPTGSGKSTLLDVITLALYNRIPRISKNISKTVIEDNGIILTKNAKDCFAEVEYSVNGKRYRSHWSIERSRNNNLQSRKQEISDVLTGEIIESGVSVPDKNTILIGLNYEHFEKSIVLAQGQFSKLLLAKRDERNMLLEDITGARDYRAIGQAVFRKFSDKKKLVEKQKTRLGEIELLDEATLEKLKKEVDNLDKKQTSLKKAVNQFKEEVEKKKNINQTEIALKKVEEDNVQLKSDLKDFKERGEVLEKHNKYVVYRELISSFSLKKKEVVENLKEIESIKSIQEIVQKSKNDLLENAGKLCREELSSDSFENKLTELKSEVLKLQNIENEAKNLVQIYKGSIQETLRKVSGFGKEIKFNEVPEVFETEVKKLISDNENLIRELNFENVSEIEERAKKCQSQKTTLDKLKLVLKEYHINTDNKSLIEKEINNINREVDNLNEELKTLELSKKKLDKEVKQLIKEEEERKRLQSLDSHRESLKDGEPCPLCGAIHHPYAENLPKVSVKESLLESKIALLEEKNKRKTTIDTSLDLYQQKIQKETKISEGLTGKLKDLKNQLETFFKALGIAFQIEAEIISDFEYKLNEEFKQIEKAKKAFGLKDELQSLEKDILKWKESFLKLNESVKNRKALYEGNNIEQEVQNLLLNWTKTNATLSSNKSQIKVLDDKKNIISKELKELENKLQIILKLHKIATIEVLQLLILSEKDAEKIRNEKTELQNKKERIEALEEQLSEKLKLIKSEVLFEEPLEKLTEVCGEKELEYAKITESIGKFKAQLDSDLKSREKNEKLTRELGELQKDVALWKTMNKLIGDEKGKRFSNFVQDLTLEQLIGYTNLRLKEINDRYILDIPTIEEVKNNDTLKVFDTHQGDARRSVYSLCGGETFMVSLAMALALSDLASKNVNIESFFIDEGFGRLDPDSLEQVITMLEKLQNEGDKSLGVISHVEALKERISTQIKLEKTGAGYSTLKII